MSSSKIRGNGASDDAYLSAEGRNVTYRSSATNLVTGDTNGVSDAFVHDRLTGTTSRVSVSATGVEGNAPSDDPAMSTTGRYIVLRSQASNFVANDTNTTKWDIFVKDTQTGAMDRVSVSSAGAQANGASADPVISADGRYVVFRSSATNLVAGDTNGQQDLFLRDRTAGTTIRISNGIAGAQANGLSDDPAISDDGGRIAFHSDATNLVAGDTNGVRDVFLYERTSGLISRASVDGAGVQGNGGSEDASIAGDGSRVGFESVATNLVAADTNAKQDVFVRTIATSTTSRISVSSTGAQSTSGSGEPSLSADGTKVAFYSTAANLVAGDTNNRGDIFVRDTVSGTTVRTSIGASGAQADDLSQNPSISGAGGTVAFQSVATNLVDADTNGLADVFVRGAAFDVSSYAYDRLDRLTAATEPAVGLTTYAYDPAGNRASRVRSGLTTTYAYDRADRITSAGANAITVTATGATTARGADTFTYDQANRLRTATVAGVSETSVYDGDGVRFSRQVGAGPITRYVTDPTAGLPVTIDDGTRTYVWGASGLAYAVAGAAIEVQHADRLGSIRAVSDASGAVIATYRTDEFGIPTTSSGAAGSPFRFTGEPTDASGLTYLRARHYDPSIGRFLSRDPFAGFASAPLSLNRYSYVGNNPATWSDPSGNCFVFCAIVGAAAGAVVGVVSYGFGTVVGNFVSGRDLTEGLDVGAALVSAANGAVVGAVTGGTFGVGTALFGTSVAWNSVESFAIATVAGPLGSAAGIVFKGLTGQRIGPADGLGALVSMVPLPDGPKVAIPLAVAVDQAVTAIGDAVSTGTNKSQVLR